MFHSSITDLKALTVYPIHHQYLSTLDFNPFPYKLEVPK